MAAQNAGAAGWCPMPAEAHTISARQASTGLENILFGGERMTVSTHSLNHFRTPRRAQLLLPVHVDQQILSFDCRVHLAKAGHLEAAFVGGPPAALEQLDKQQDYALLFETESGPFKLYVQIEAIGFRGRLRLQASGQAYPTRVREYFRVDTRLRLTYRRLDRDNDSAEKTFYGSVNLSGSGLRFLPRQYLAIRERLELILHLSESEEVSCVAQVVRHCGSSGRNPQVAMEFIDIGARERDTIIAFCMATQRKSLRTKVRTRDLD